MSCDQSLLKSLHIFMAFENLSSNFCRQEIFWYLIFISFKAFKFVTARWTSNTWCAAEKRSRILVASNDFFSGLKHTETYSSFSPTHLHQFSLIHQRLIIHSEELFNDTFWSIKMQCWSIMCHFIYNRIMEKMFTMSWRWMCLWCRYWHWCRHLAS